jgi:hypothetical protein
MKQQRQKSVEGRRDIMTGGLAGMMSNFWFLLNVTFSFGCCARGLFR